MPLTVRSMEERDVERALRIQYAAFRTPGKIGELLSPNPTPSDQYITSSTTSRLEAMRSNPAAHFVVVEDTDLGQLIACTHYDLYPDQRSEEQVEKLCKKSDPPPDANAAAWRDFFGFFGRERRKLGTRPIAILHTLVTDPQHQGRGAGKLLMQRFTEDLDKVRLEAYLEGSEMARPLYAKFGFQAQHEEVFDLTKYGKESGTEVNTIMIRPAKV